MTDVPAAGRSLGWTIGLWVAQVLLAALFLYAGITKATQPPETLAAMGWDWALTLPAAFIVFLGIMEILGAIGIVLPAATRILPILTPMAALGMAIVQVSAMVLHGMRGESIVLNLALLALALFVLWGRTRKAPIAGR